MKDDTTTRALGLKRAMLAGVVVAASGWPCDGFAQDLAVEAVEVEVKPAELENELDLTHFGPGFMLPVADVDLQKQVAKLDRFLKAEDWAKAFRLLSELGNDQLDVLVSAGEGGQHIAVKEQLQRHLLSLPPDGLRAFRLYFDGQAKEQLDAVKNHPMPGSEAQLVLAQSLADRLLASSIGGEAAVMLGDMYFERGLFARADRYWRLALEQGLVTGQAAFELQAKRAIAMHREGDESGAAALYGELKARYGQATLQIGDQKIDAIQMLGQTLGQIDQPDVSDNNEDKTTVLLPADDAMPSWHLRFLDRATRGLVLQSQNRRSYYSPPHDIDKHVPDVVADDQRVYFHWIGVVFALERQTGKIAWTLGSMRETAESLQQRVQSNQGDPRNYNIALAGDVLLVTSAKTGNINGPMVISAYDKQNGRLLWNSNTTNGWNLESKNTEEKTTSSVLGEVSIVDGKAYTVVHRVGQSDCFLRRFDPATGSVDWTLELGGAEPIVFQYTQVNRMPQPRMLKGESLLYVMMNNGALIAVDVVSSEIRWALRMDAPFGLGDTSNGQPFFRGNQLGNKFETMANPNGSGRMILQGGTLYAKEHNGKKLYALDAETGDLNWAAGQLKPDARLIGVDAEQFYLMDRGIASYSVKGNHDLVKKNAQTGSPDEGGAMLLEDKILFYANHKLRQLDTTHLDPAGKYSNDDYLGQSGGRLYQFGDLLVCIDATQITAFRTQPTDKN